MMLRLRVVLAAVVLGGLGLLVTPTSASAQSCAFFDAVAQDSDRVFLGRVVEREDDRITVQVIENRGTVSVPETITLRLAQWDFDPPESWPRVSDEIWAFALPDGDVASRCTSSKVSDLDASWAPSSPPSATVPNEAWNAESNPDMARLAAKHEAASEAPASHSTGELAGWAGVGLLLGGVTLAATRRRLFP